MKISTRVHDYLQLAHFGFLRFPWKGNLPLLPTSVFLFAAHLVVAGQHPGQPMKFVADPLIVHLNEQRSE